MAVKPIVRRFSIVLICLLSIGVASAQSSSPSSAVVFASIREPTSGASLVRRADYVSFAVTVTSSESDFVNRMKLLGDARNVITDALSKQGVRFETGPNLSRTGPAGRLNVQFVSELQPSKRSGSSRPSPSCEVE